MGEAVNSEWKMENEHSCIFRKQKAKDSRQAVFFYANQAIVSYIFRTTFFIAIIDNCRGMEYYLSVENVFRTRGTQKEE